MLTVVCSHPPKPQNPSLAHRREKNSCFIRLNHSSMDPIFFFIPSILHPQELRGQMSQLRPLLSVVEQYRLDLQTLATLRLELLNLSVILSAIQEEIGAYDYEELQQRVLLLESRLHSCMNKLGKCWNIFVIFSNTQKSFTSAAFDIGHHEGREGFTEHAATLHYGNFRVQCFFCLFVLFECLTNFDHTCFSDDLK